MPQGSHTFRFINKGMKSSIEDEEKPVKRFQAWTSAPPLTTGHVGRYTSCMKVIFVDLLSQY